MYYVYILQSQKHGNLYTGSTNNLKRRLTEHNNGSVSYTKTGLPWKLKWYCAFEHKTKARMFEKYLKSSSGFAFRNKRLISNSSL